MSKDAQIPEIVKRYETDHDAFFDADEYYDIADYYESVIDTDSAFAVIVKGLSAYPDDVALRVELVRLNIAVGGVDKADKLLSAIEQDKCIDSREDRLAIRMLRVKIDVERGDLEKMDLNIKAIPEWVKGVDREEAVSAITDMASSMFLSFFYRQAKDVLLKGIKLFPDEICFYETLIECQLKDGRNFKKAIEIAEKAIDIDPYNATLWFKLGYINYFDDNTEEAIKGFDYATSIDDKYYEAWKAMAECHDKLENYEKAAECYVKSLNPKKEDIGLLVTIGDMFNNCGKYAEARSYYKQALDIDDSKDDALFGIGMSYFLDTASSPTNFEMAVFWIKRAINEADGNSIYWEILGDCHFFTGNWVLALQAFQKSLSLRPTQADVMVKMGQSYYALEEYENALFITRKAKNIDNDIKQADMVIATTYYKLGDYPKSIYYLMQASEKDINQLNVFLDENPDATFIAESVKKLL